MAGVVRFAKCAAGEDGRGVVGRRLPLQYGLQNGRHRRTHESGSVVLVIFSIKIQISSLALGLRTMERALAPTKTVRHHFGFTAKRASLPPKEAPPPSHLWVNAPVAVSHIGPLEHPWVKGRDTLYGGIWLEGQSTREPGHDLRSPLAGAPR